MSGDKQRLNGTGPNQNGINGSDDVEMKEGSQNAKKGAKNSKDKDGDSDMTVVVPPSKGSNTPSAPHKATDADEDGETEIEEPVDPQQKAIEGNVALRRPVGGSTILTWSQKSRQICPY